MVTACNDAQGSQNYSCSFNIPNVGIFCSQRGNIPFPTWEHFIPNVGISDTVSSLKSLS